MRKSIIQSKTEPNKNDIWLSEEGLKKYGKDGWESLGGGISPNTPIVNEVSGNELVPINVNGENKAVSAAALVKGAKEVYSFNLLKYSVNDFEELTQAIIDGKIILLNRDNNIPLMFTPYFMDSVWIHGMAFQCLPGIMDDGSLNALAVQCVIIGIGRDGNINGDVGIINFEFVGDGTKFLSDDGTYKEVSGGSEPYIWDGTTSETIFNELMDCYNNGRQVLLFSSYHGVTTVTQLQKLTDDIIIISTRTESVMLTKTDITSLAKIVTEHKFDSELSAGNYNPYRYNPVNKDITITFDSSNLLNGICNYEGEFTFGDTVYTVTFPEGVKWSTDSVLEYKANHTYQFRILNNLGVMKEFANA